MSYAIVRVQKMKQGDLKGIQFHNQRERESQTNKEIDKDRSHLNYDLVNENGIDYVQDINQMIKDNVQTKKAIRKDAVRVAEFMVTSDKEFFDSLSPEQEKAYFEKSLEFFKEKYGEEKIAYATVHKDEKTPHMHVGFVPVTEDHRLSAKDFFGRKSQLHQLQNEFYQHVKENGFDLERGVSSDRKHIEINKFKAMTQQQELEKLEGKLEQIKPINAEMEKLDDIKGKTAFNTTVLSKHDYELLKETAESGFKAHYELQDTQQELLSFRDEYKQFKHDMGQSQQEVRGHAQKTIQEAQKDVQTIQKDNNTLKQENKHIKANMDGLATEKAEEIRTKIDNTKIDQARFEGYLRGEKNGRKELLDEIRPKWDKIVSHRKELIQENKELTNSNKRLSIDRHELQHDNKHLKEQADQVKPLQQQNKRLTEQLQLMNQHLNRIKQQLYETVKQFETYKEQSLEKWESFKDHVKTKVTHFIGRKIKLDPDMEKYIPSQDRFHASERMEKLFKAEANDLFNSAEEKAMEKTLELDKNKEMELGD